MIIQKDILSFTSTDLSTQLASLGWEKYRIKQLNNWLWKHCVRDFNQMTNLSVKQREELTNLFTINSLREDKKQISNDGTIKFRYALHDDKKIESVLIPVADDKRFTVCVSSQVGCSLTCSFCATGKMGLARQLTAGEIFDQVVQVNKTCQDTYGKGLSNIVYMGMGEPLLNYKNVCNSISQLISSEGLNFSHNRITVSTAGIAKMIIKLAEDGYKVNLALSLHAADDAKRNEMMPINESNNLHSLMQALKYYQRITGNRISFEYIAFEHFNDTEKDAKNLVKLCSHFPVIVNIIEYNTVQGVDYMKSSEDRLNNFAKYLLKHGVMTTVRKSRGKDIDAACGQLANKG
ncbi:MAG: 23S rRNA (adenine(2503)-C(2))-methyltransferase RlmN [Saprospiraceae bacterium]|jgi:23S rRNA (adenine2503-C2)-methyltransferase|nr:23S rRNA (adenine(2503)-C(2))-methyltransferase RlmN [Saprospiraceae bacterium]MBK9995021.1 23S rRNA (adenine(2503)-C(2))-methyltransferase RlmN [Saprospiraceae bacterium]